MSGFIEGENRYQSTMFPERVDDFVDEDSVVRVIDVFIDRHDISGLGFKAEAAENFDAEAKKALEEQGVQVRPNPPSGLTIQ